ncbi:HAD-IIB family hydrolase [Vagococcus fluvialis]|uniref:HAD-IIB family hydrolase n=1 Tax=Vagococcus fluvialis TaxID=2738 RepID=UPI0014329ACB|nr:HAD-IIB family hydrolase [Vagococcus fluvialis]NKC59891.1 HAD-IIB family hydrolase [Vagococcus fluvialis]NKD51715.1 HAD-IIB family hydrolase [Vagococcus fluvialis]
MTVVFDLDGTTIFKGKKMTAEVTHAIETLSKSRQVVFASARPIRDMLPVLPTQFHSFDLVGGNGAFTRQKDLIKTTEFNKEQVDLITNIIKTYDLSYMLDSQWDYSYQGDTTHPLYLGIDPLKTANNVHISELDCLVKAVLFTTDSEVIKKLEKADIAVNFHGAEELIDLSPTNISKRSAFESLNIPGNFTMFGNDTNDLPMFEVAETNFVVGNLVSDIQNATYITQTEVPSAILSLI